MSGCNDRIAASRRKIEEIETKQDSALARSNAEGVTEEETKSALAEFDALQNDKKLLKASLRRDEELLRDQQESVLAAVAPARQQAFNPQAATVGATAGVDKLFARPRRHGPLKAFKKTYASDHEAEKAAYISGMWAGAVLFRGSQYAGGMSAYCENWCRENGVPLTARGDPMQPMAVMTTNNPGSAGVFVSPVLDAAIVRMFEEYGVLRRDAEVVAMTSETKTSPRWTGSMIAYWIAQGQKPQENDPTWDAVMLVAKDLAAMTKMSDQLDEDSIVDLGEQVAIAMALAFTFAEDSAGFLGDGSSGYGGIVGILPRLLLAANAASLIQAAATHTSPAKLTMADFESIVGQFPSYPNAKPKWYCHKSVFWGVMAALQLAANGNRVEDIARGPRPQFLSYEVEFVNAMPNITNYVSTATSPLSIPVVFADLALGVKLGDRRSRAIVGGYENDDFTRQLRTILGTQRVDVNVHTLVDPRIAGKAGPIMGLQLAAA